MNEVCFPTYDVIVIGGGSRLLVGKLNEMKPEETRNEQ